MDASQVVHYRHDWVRQPDGFFHWEPESKGRAEQKRQSKRGAKRADVTFVPGQSSISQEDKVPRTGAWKGKRV